MTASGATHWCEHAWLGDPATGAQPGVALTIDGDRIAAVETGVAAPPGVERLAGFTTPGFANAHSHAFHRALRGRTHGAAGSFWTWRDQMYELAGRLDPERLHDLARATFAEMALAGFTCVGEFHYLHHGPQGEPYGEPNAMAHALQAAASAAGVRLTLLDACYLRGGLSGAPPEAQQRRFVDRDVALWAARAGELLPSPGCRVGAAIHSVRAVDPAAIESVAAWARDRGAPLHAHVSEQPAENEECQAVHGCTPAELLHRHGAVSDRFTAVHATHVTPSDVDRLGSAGASACFCPTTERDLADGIGPSAALSSAGASLCLGTDSNAVIDPFEEARAVELDERLRSLRRGTHPPATLLTMASAAGYRSLGWPEGGRIEPGALADLTTIDLGSVRLAGADLASVDAAVVFAASAADVRQVMVGGRVVVRDGAHVAFDVPAELQRSIGAVWA